MPPSKPAVVSSAHGPIRQLLVAYSSDRMQGVIEELGRLLPAYCRLVIWVASARRRTELVRFLRSHNLPFEDYNSKDQASTARFLILSPQAAPLFYGDSSWTQDPFLVLTNRAERSLRFICPPACAGTGRNQDLPEQLIDAGFPALIQHIPWFHFQGGNCLAGDDFMLIGGYDFRQTMALLKFGDPVGKEMNVAELELYTRQKIGSVVGKKRVIPVGTPDFLSPGRCFVQAREIYQILNRDIVPGGHGLIQPFPHLDLYISLAGRDAKTNDYQLLMAEIIPLTNTTDDQARAVHLNRHLAAVAKRLERDGPFRIRRNPVPLLPGNHFAYYNNCLVELCARKKKKVWLPQFGRDDREISLKNWDEKNAIIWESLGFDVIPLKTLYPFALRRGAVHCLIKYLYRT